LTKNRSIVAGSTNAAAVRIGDSATSASRGLPVAAGGGLMYPPLAPGPRPGQADQYYDLSAIYYYATAGDKLSVSWGK
jgi:hypothetical protein